MKFSIGGRIEICEECSEVQNNKNIKPSGGFRIYKAKTNLGVLYLHSFL